MRYYPVHEIEILYELEKVRKSSRLLWYKIAEGFEMIPNSYHDFTSFISFYEKNIFKVWKLQINNDGSISLMRTIENSNLYLQIDRGGRETFKISPK